MPTPHHPLWEKPVHHESNPNKTEQVHWIELCYDLIHVVAIFMLGNHLTNNLDILGFISFIFLFITLWISWGDYAFYNSLYVSRDYKHRIISALHITTVMIMAASIPNIYGSGIMYFMIAYAINRLILAFLYRRARKHNHHTLAAEMYRNFFILAVVFLIAAFLPTPWNIIIFIFGLLVLQLSYLHPKYGIMRFPNFTPRREHLSERFSLLLLICLGEGYFKMVLALGEKGVYNIDFDILLNYIMGGVVLFFLAWMYFDFRHDGVMKDNTRKTMATWWYAHMFLMLSALLISVALKAEVNIHFYESYPIEYALFGCIGLIGYLVSIEVIQRKLKNKFAYRFTNWKIKCIGIIPAVLTFITVYLEMSSLLGNILYFAAVVSQLLIPMIYAYFTVKDEVHQMNKKLL